MPRYGLHSGVLVDQHRRRGDIDVLAGRYEVSVGRYFDDDDDDDDGQLAMARELAAVVLDRLP